MHVCSCTNTLIHMFTFAFFPLRWLRMIEERIKKMSRKHLSFDKKNNEKKHKSAIWIMHRHFNAFEFEHTRAYTIDFNTQTRTLAHIQIAIQQYANSFDMFRCSIDFPSMHRWNSKNFPICFVYLSVCLFVCLFVFVCAVRSFVHSFIWFVCISWFSGRFFPPFFCFMRSSLSYTFYF